MLECELKEIQDRFYKCRDFEISNLWQRSILLTAFLLLCFTGYGNIIKYIFENLEMVDFYYHEIAAFISIVGMVFSIFWIMMGKASKAWYEFYEDQICSIENEKELGIKECYRMGNSIYNTDNKKIDGNIFTNNAGIYSPSKINIRIGHLCLIIWVVIFLIHIYLIRCTIIKNICNVNYSKMHIFFFFIFIILFIFIIVTAIKNKWAKSGFLSQFKSE